MANNTALTRTDQPTSLTAVLPALPDESALAYMVRLMEMLPPPTEDVIDRIAAGILNAASPMDENQLWDATGSKDAVGRRFIFHSVHIQASDYEDSPLPYYVVASVTDLDSGERTVLTSGSVNICASLIKAQVLGNLPWEAEIVGPRRVPKSGRLPLHLRWYGRVVESVEDNPGRDS